MTLDLNKPIETKDGKKVTILTTEFKTEDAYNLGGLIHITNRRDEWSRWNYAGSCVCGSTDDLVNIPVKKTGWLNVYSLPRSSAFSSTCYLYHTESDAFKNKGGRCVNTIKIEWEE